MLLKDIMRRDPITATSHDRLGDLQRRMRALHIRHLPVVDGARVVGILTERDLLAFRARSDREDWWRAPASSAMHAPVQTAGPDDSLTEAAGRMAASKIGALPIVERGHLIGLVTVTDVLGAEVDAAMR